MNQIQKIFSLVAIVVALVGCGGGGPHAGECLFAPAPGCNESGNGDSSITSPPSPNVSPSAPIPTQPAFSQSGIGDTQLTLPNAVSIISISAEFLGGSSNFILYANNDLTINEIIGSAQYSSKIQGAYVVDPGSTIRISNSNGVSWKISSFSPPQPSSSTLVKSGVGDQVFYLPNRNSNYRVRASYPSKSQNFIVYANGSLEINEILGASNTPPVYDGTIALPAFTRVEIQGSPGVVWEFSELR